MGFRFRLGKHKNKLIALLLFLSILSQQLVCMADVKDIFEGAVEATPETSKYVAKTYYDFMNSVAESCGYTMEEILDPEVDDSLDYKDYGKASFVRFINWYSNVYTDDYNGDENAIEFLKSELDQCSLFGFKMSQKLWDAFKQFFSDVENDKQVDDDYDIQPSEADLYNYLKKITGFDISGYCLQFGTPSRDQPNCLVYTGESNFCRFHSGCHEYLFIVPRYSSTTKNWSIKTVNGIANCVALEGISNEYYTAIVIHEDGSAHYMTTAYINPCSSVMDAKIIATNWSFPISIKKKYSPFINYKSSGSAPTQVPDIIPWSTFPDHEVTDDDTKIYIPVESPDEETPTETPEDPTETPEQPTETPEDPTETPGDSDDGDDITNLVPIFPDIDIDPDIHLPDDWINPPDIDLDPDVDVDTPSPGGKIPHLQKLKEKFPFCIPFDLVLLFKMLNKKPKAPKWEFKHDFQIGDSKPYTWEVVVDMADYDKYVQIFREGFFLLFLVGLFFVTKKLISWQTG